jgi:uncharacterized membrane protein YidH (DUF202 family)
MAGADPDLQRFEVRVTADSHFGWIRTRLSVERTMMSWIRTAVSLIGFGFAIVQFFERLQQMPGITPASFPRAPQYLGLALISCGVLARFGNTFGLSATGGARRLRQSPACERVRRTSRCNRR